VVRFEPEPDAAYRGDQLGRVGVVAELASQRGEVHVERLGRAEPVLVPDLRHRPLAGDDAAGVADQQDEQVELLRRELQLAFVAPCAARIGVHAHPARGQRRRLDAPHQRADSGEQFGEPERLGDVVVGAGIQALHGVELLGARREDQHGDARARLSDAPADLQPVEARQPHVEHEQVVFALDSAPGGLGAVGDDLDLVALAGERALERVGDPGVVLGEQQAGHRAASYAPSPAAPGCLTKPLPRLGPRVGDGGQQWRHEP
jgi:hypothetical protein